MQTTRLVRASAFIPLLVGLMFAGIAWGRVGPGFARVNPDSIDLKMDVSGLNAEQVRLYRGAVLARHCHQFADGLVRAEFQDYLGKHCGVSYESEGSSSPERNPTPADSAFTPAESDFLQRLARHETDLRARQVQISDSGPVYDRAAIVNLSQFKAPSDSVMQRLLGTGFVVLPGRRDQLFQVYEENDYHMFPNFITVDAVLQIYHLYYDFCLRQVEQERLLPAVADLSQRLTDQLRAQYDSARGTPRAEPLRRAILYFAVATMLTRPDSTASTPPWLEAAWRSDLDEQLGLIRAMASVHEGPILRTVDYTMFRARGHYTRNEELARYFRTMTWLGLPGFVLEDENARAAGLEIVHALVSDRRLEELYDQIYDPTTFYVGPTDDITPRLVREVADSVCGPGAGSEQWIAKQNVITAGLIRRNPTRIKTQFGDDRDLPQVRFMGTRYVPDSEILQRLCFSPERPTPTGLDLFCAMSVGPALTLQKADTRLPGEYWTEMERLRNEFGNFQAPAGSSNLYRGWLHLLRTINQPAPAGAAPFMRTAPWELKDLSTSLASWAQLRHDTILYVKQSGGAECGGGEIPPRVVGYVEARPDVFGEMVDLQQYTVAELERRGLLPRGLQDVGKQVEDLLVLLRNVSRKEVAGETPTDEEYDRIRILGADLEYLTGSLMEVDGPYFQWEGPSRSIATIADVHTTKRLDGGETALEEGVGRADEIYALVEIEGSLYITRGAVFSWYEFEHPAGDRLTDEKWQQLLEDAQAPARPAWIGRILMHDPAPDLPERYAYSSGC